MGGMTKTAVTCKQRFSAAILIQTKDPYNMDLFEIYNILNDPVID